SGTGTTGEQLCRYLQLNGVPAKPLTVGLDGRLTGEVILAHANALGCDLLIKGAYTQSRLRQMIFGGTTRSPLRWGLIPAWCNDPNGGRKPINAKCETVRDLPTFRDAYRLRRCIVPVDGFFEWKAIKGQKAKQPYAIAMKEGAPFGIAGIWENWK